MILGNNTYLACRLLTVQNMNAPILSLRQTHRVPFTQVRRTLDLGDMYTSICDILLECYQTLNDDHDFELQFLAWFRVLFRVI